MSNHLHPVKLWTLLKKLDLPTRSSGPLTRIPMYTPEVHDAFVGVGVDRRHYRLAFDAVSLNFNEVVDSAVLEVYDMDDKLVNSLPVVHLKGAQALAVQCELLFKLLKQHGCYINAL